MLFLRGCLLPSQRGRGAAQLVMLPTWGTAGPLMVKPVRTSALCDSKRPRHQGLS